MNKQIICLTLGSAFLFALTSCATTQSMTPDEDASAPVASESSTPDIDRPVPETPDQETNITTAVATLPDTDPDEESKETNVSLGSGVFAWNSGKKSGNTQNGASDEDGVTLNFEAADLREFIRVVFETILQENYLIDSKIKGSVTLHTTQPVQKAAVIPILESVLQLNGAALVYDQGISKIIPLADAAGEAGSPTVSRRTSGRSRGYGIQVVPLLHVAAGEIEKILSPFVPAGSAMRVDEARNLIILSGPQYRLDELLATIRTFDVDWLKGMSFGLFRLEYADAPTLVAELENVYGSEGETPLAGIVRFMPIERLNAVLVITHRPDHIGEVQKLIEKLDWGMEGTSGRRLFVYELENGKAENIATLLQEIFGQGQGGMATITSAQTFESESEVFRSAGNLTRPPPPPGSQDAGSRFSRNATSANLVANDSGEADGLSAESQGEVRIIADSDNNAILVMASQQDYRAIEATIRRLDIAPRQVLIEATIAEVTLSNTLDYGVRWFLEKSNFQIGFNAPVPEAAIGEGLAFALFDDSSDLSAFFDVLETQSSVKFLSTPQVMVLDNQTANMRVGDQIPVTTRSSQSTVDPNAPVVREVQFRDTGTLLTVTPHINAGGQITLEISQEVSLPGTEPAVGGGGNVAIAQRTITSSVIVHSGQVVVLGGLILETTTEGKSGIPILMDIPWLGALFSTNSEDVFRTELIITVSPTIIENQMAVQQVTEELRSKMKRATEYENAVKADRNL